MREEKLPEFRSNDELPLVMSAKDVAGYLHISRSYAYQVMNIKEFPSVRIGKRNIVTKEHFLNWIENAKGVIL